MDSYDKQLELEITSVQRGVERYQASLAKEVERGREWDGGVGGDYVSRIIHTMLPAVVALQKSAVAKLVEAQTTGRRLGGWEMAIALSDPAAMAYITIRSLLGGTTNRLTKHVLSRRIGRIINQELQWKELREAERERAKTDPPNRLASLKRTVKQINPKSLNKWLNKLDDVQTTVWDNETLVKVGLELLGVLVETCGAFVSMDTYAATEKNRTRTYVSIQVREHIRRAIQEQNDTRAHASPWLTPMLCAPSDWKAGGGGGYLTISSPLIKRGFGEFSADPADGEMSAVCLDALNAVSKTAWCINERVRRIAAHAVENDYREVTPVEPVREMPEYVPQARWEGMSKEDRVAVLRRRKEAYDVNFKLQSKRETVDRMLTIAEQFSKAPEIFFPHNLDFRGRAYPLPQDLHPQASDFARGLLTFAESKPLGKEGLTWLAYHAANTYGMDKMTRDEQFTWVLDNLSHIWSVATDPFGSGMEFWKEADDPWQFIAVAIELEDAFNYPGGPTEYPSSLPVCVDGSCNGLQHLSAMGLDPVGAHATNLTADPVRQDIYQIVADKVAWAVENETDPIHGGKTFANPWRGRVDRKTVKRGVMTTPYGVTRIGMRDQLINDKMANNVDEANCLTPLMQEAISDTVVKGREIMEWMQANAHILAVNNKAMKWTSPSGFVAEQAYYTPRYKQIRTLIGSTSLLRRGKDPTIALRKQTLAIAPNIIHSFDAAHMSLTIQRAKGLGVDSFMVVHDSFGCHASDMNVLLPVLREEFVKIYEKDWFAALQAEFQATAGDDVRLIPPPERGDFDIHEVKKAQYFFA